MNVKELINFLEKIPWETKVVSSRYYNKEVCNDDIIVYKNKITFY